MSFLFELMPPHFFSTCPKSLRWIYEDGFPLGSLSHLTLVRYEVRCLRLVLSTAPRSIEVPFSPAAKTEVHDPPTLIGAAKFRIDWWSGHVSRSTFRLNNGQGNFSSCSLRMTVEKRVRDDRGLLKLIVAPWSRAWRGYSGCLLILTRYAAAYQKHDHPVASLENWH